jgi:uncharacterized protein YndB with AHSA1/START domain
MYRVVHTIGAPRGGEMKFETTVQIDAPPDIVWDTLIDVDHWPEWTDSIQQVTWLDGTTLKSGNRVRIKQPGMPSLVWEVSEFEPDASFAWKCASPGVTTLGTHMVMKTADDRSSVTFGIHQSGVLAPIVSLFTGPRTKRYVQMEADGLKKRAEAVAS